MVDMVTVSAAISAATSAVGLIDAIWDQVDRFLEGRSAPIVPKEHWQRIEQDGDAIVSRNGITFERLG